MAGIVVTAANLHLQVGTIARLLDQAHDDLAEMKEFLDQHSSADLQTKFGVSAADADLIKSAFDATMATASTTFVGNASMAFMKQLKGMESL